MLQRYLEITTYTSKNKCYTDLLNSLYKSFLEDIKDDPGLINATTWHR